MSFMAKPIPVARPVDTSVRPEAGILSITNTTIMYRPQTSSVIMLLARLKLMSVSLKATFSPSLRMAALVLQTR